MGPIVRAIGAGVGFIAEATSNKDKSFSNDPPRATSQVLSPSRDHALSNTTLSPQTHDSDDPESDFELSDGESYWVLDEEATKARSVEKHHDFQGQIKVESLVSMVLSKSSPPPYSLPSNSLPVIIPQRRPGTRGRGFVRAYSPILAEYGIAQGTFLSFVENFDLAVKISPVLGVIQLSAGVVGLVPHGYAMLASSLTQIIVGAAMEYQQRARGNSYLDQINEKLFKPRGLYAVVMTYVPNAHRPVSVQSTDFNALVNGTVPTETSLLGPKIQRGESYGELELPDAAPLVFPGIDEATRQKILQENAFKRGLRWTGDYMDRRSQAQWIHNNPDSRLNSLAEQTKPEFKSRLADPLHPAFQGSWPTLLSGGRIVPKIKISKEEKRAMKAERKEEKHARDSRSIGSFHGPYTPNADETPLTSNQLDGHAPQHIQAQRQPARRRRKMRFRVKTSLQKSKTKLQD